MNIFEVYSEFQPRLKDFGDCYLAGGCVRDHLMGRTPKDFDLFILNQNNFKNFKEYGEKIKQTVSDLTELEPVVYFHRSEPFLVSSVKFNENEIQILFNPAPTVQELLNTFDWNVCLFSYGQRKDENEPSFFNLGDINTIKPNETLKLNKVTFPLSTLRRGFRFSERFKMKLDRDDIKLLCSKIIENKKDFGPAGNEPDMPSLEKNVLVEA